MLAPDDELVRLHKALRQGYMDPRSGNTLSEGPPTRSAWVDQQLREAILNGDFEPGERLLIAPLAERFSVSPTPLREALQRLAAEGIVDITPQRGARVAPLSLEDALGLIYVRRLLEPAAIKETMAQRDLGRAREAVTAYPRTIERLSGDPATTPLDWARVSRQLCEALTCEAPVPPLLRALASVLDQLTRYHVVAMHRFGAADLLPDRAGELPAFLDEGNLNGVIRVVSDHLDAFESALSELPRDGRQIEFRGVDGLQLGQEGQRDA